MQQQEQQQKRSSGRVLQLNSTVVAGFAGAKSSTFPMQALGLDVDCIYSTQHSNHSGYSHVAKSDVPRAVLNKLFDGLVQNNLLQGRYDYFFSGFVADEGFLHDICDWYKQIKATNPRVRWFCDTVIGDQDKQGNQIFYCPRELVPLYREYVLPLADVITPNQLELELLSDTKISTRQEAIDAMKVLHDRGVEVFFLTSVRTEYGSEMLVSSMENGSEQQVFHASFDESPHHFTGTGDCMMGLLLGNMFQEPDDAALAASRALSSMQAIVKRTVDSLPTGEKNIQNESAHGGKDIELKIIQSVTDIVQAPSTHSFVRI